MTDNHGIWTGVRGERKSKQINFPGCGTQGKGRFHKGGTNSMPHALKRRVAK